MYKRHSSIYVELHIKMNANARKIQKPFVIFTILHVRFCQLQRKNFFAFFMLEKAKI